MFGVVVKRKFVYKPVGVNTAAGDPLGVKIGASLETPDTHSRLAVTG